MPNVAVVPEVGAASQVGLPTIAAQWARIGIIGFGGPPAHIALLRRLCVQDRGWLSDQEFEDGIAAANLLPGPASTQLAIFCAWRLRGWTGGLLGGACFILPGLVVILALATALLAGHPSRLVLGAAAGAGAAVPAVAVQAAASLVPPSWRRAADQGGPARGGPGHGISVRAVLARGDIAGGRLRWIGYAVAGALAAVLLGPWLVLVLVACGVVEAAVTGAARRREATGGLLFALPRAASAASLPVWASIAWTALKVGALSYGGGFVIIPLMRADAVDRYHWMTGDQFLYAVALGQITPGPVVQTVAVVGYAAAGLAGGLLASVVAFAPSFAFVLGGGRHFDRLRRNAAARAFLAGAGPAAIGAIAGSAVQLGLTLTRWWEAAVVAGALLWLFALRRGVVSTLLLAAATGVGVAAAGLTVT